MPNNYADIVFYINGQQVNPPKDWLELKILATFENDSPEANITTSDITFINEEAKIIRNWIAGGSTGASEGIFQGIPFRIQLLNSSSAFDTFEGYLNLANGYKQQSVVQVVCKIEKLAGIISFSQRVQGLTYNYLQTLGVFGSSDFTNVPYVVQREFEILEFAMLSISTFMLVRELADTIRRLSDDVANIVAHTTGGATGPAAAAIYAIAIALINAIYAALIVIYLIQLIKELISYLFVPTRMHKGITLRKSLEKACNYLGYQFASSITDLDVVYLPTKSKPGKIDLSQFNPPIAQNAGADGRGLPNSSDYGYTVAEMFQIVTLCCDAKITIRNIGGQDTVCVEPLNNTAFWYQSGSFTIPDTLEQAETEQKEFNTDELKANRLISFTLDNNDYWTLNNFRGNSYEITTDALVCSNEKMKLLKGFEEVRIPCALPTRKSGLTDFEQALKTLAQIADSVINFFGGSSNMAGYITNRIGAMIMSSDLMMVPKLVKLENGKLAQNYRDTWSAKYLEDTYHNRKSFVRNNYGNQYRVFNDYQIPFGFQDFLSLVNFGSCSNQNGQPCEIKKIEWEISSDKATASWKTKEIYTKNLTETFREEADNAEGSI